MSGISGGNPVFAQTPERKIDLIQALCCFQTIQSSLDSIVIYLFGLMISVGNLRLLKRPSVADRWKR